MKYSATTLLAILQQAEYDLSIWKDWLAAPRTEQEITTLQSLQPERWTSKLRLIATLSRALSLIMPPALAIQASVHLLRPIEAMVTTLLVQLAAWKLRRYQRQGLTVVAIAGSYGKTSVKHLTHHGLSSQWSTLMSPASFNTPLGLSLTILKRLKRHHHFFLAELGEYAVGDIAAFLKWVQPQVAILTPIGFAHAARLANPEDMVRLFTPLIESPQAPEDLYVDAHNRELLPSTPTVHWYGSHPDSDYVFQAKQSDFNGSQGHVTLPSGSLVPLQTRLLGQHTLENALPALALTEQFQGNVQLTARTFRYAPDIPRRLTVTANANGTYLIDNSYNTNPGSWQHMVTLLRSLQLEHLAVVTAGFVELDPNTNEAEHQQMAQDLAELADVVGLIPSRYNHALAEALNTNHTPYVVGHNLDEVIARLSEQPQPLQYLWLEGGMRELYQ